MGTLISNEVLNEFAVVGEPGDIVPEMKRRYGDFVDRTSVGIPFADPQERAAAMKALQAP